MDNASARPARSIFVTATRLALAAALGIALLCVAPPSPEPGPGRAAPRPELDMAVAGVPAPPIVVYREDFENGMGPTATGAKSLTANALGAPQYTGAGGATYSADTNWREGQRCSGVVLAYANGDSTRDDGGGPSWATTGRTANAQVQQDKCSPLSGVQSYNGIRTLARAMGQVTGGGDTNHMVSTYTECNQDGAGNTVSCDTLPVGPMTSRMFETVQQIPVTPNHYYTFAVDAVAGNCTGGTVPVGSDPQYQFQLLSGATRTDLGSSLNPCRDVSRQSFTVNRPRAVGSSTTMSGFVSRLRADTAFMYAGSSLGVAMYNKVGITNGNDGGFDNIEVRDVTPTVDKTFSPTLLEPTQVSTLTLTITNTSDLLAKTDWGFVDTLPAGLALASTSFGGTCVQKAGSAFTRTGAVGGNTLTVTGGDLALGDVSCTITAQVTSASEGSYTNSPTTNMTLTGLVPGSPGTVAFAWPRITLAKELGSDRVRAGDQFTVALRTGSGTGTVVSNPSNATTTGTGAAVTTGTGTTGAYVARSGTPYYLTESGAGTTDLTTYDATVTCVDATGRTTGLPTNVTYTGSNAVTPALGARITCTITNRAKAPTLRLIKALGSERAADTDEFTVAIRAGSATGAVVSSAVSATTTGTGATVTAGTGTTGSYTATAGTTYHLTEAAAGTTDLADYAKTITCTDGAGLQSGLPTNARITESLQVTPVAGARISCVLTNTLTRVDVHLLKQAQEAGGSWTPVAGSTWELHADDQGALGPALPSPTVQAVAGENGAFRVAGLAPGTYWLVETKAPAGQQLLAEPLQFTVDPQGVVTLGAGAGPDVATVGQTAYGDPQIRVRNFTAAELPDAGGAGISAWRAGGLLMLLLAALLCLALGARQARRSGVSVRP